MQKRKICTFVLYKNWTDLNSDNQSRSLICRPLDHHYHGPTWLVTEYYSTSDLQFYLDSVDLLDKITNSLTCLVELEVSTTVKSPL